MEDSSKRQERERARERECGTGWTSWKKVVSPRSRHVCKKLSGVLRMVDYKDFENSQE